MRVRMFLLSALAVIFVGHWSAPVSRADSFTVTIESTTNPVGNPVNLSGSSPLSASVTVTGKGPNGGGGMPIGTFTDTATAAAGAGVLRGSSLDIINYTNPLGGQAGFVSEIETNSSFNLNGLRISGPAGTISVSFNVNVTGSLAASAGVGRAGQATVSLFGGQGSSFGGGGIGVNGATLNSNGTFSGSGIFSGLSNAGNISAPFQTPLFQTFAGDPSLYFALQLHTTAFCALSTGAFAGQNCTASSDWAHTISFPTNGPVMNLPAGYTVNSLDGSIVNNHFAPPPTTIPEPSTLLLFGSGLIAMAGAARRKLLN